MSILNSTIIVADDLTGANDTALQYFKTGLSAKIVIDIYTDFNDIEDVDVWAISTESRNTTKEKAVERVVLVSQKLKDSLGIENFYKKIDSTLRGNTGVEIVSMLETTGKDIAIIAPAYIEEGRTTVGSYQLLNGIILERTQCALDPKAPIYESYIPDILKKDLNTRLHDLIGTIELRTVTKGAGPIVLKINELVRQGKKLIVADAMSNVDLEQIALAINKSSYDILPCGSAGLANALNKISFEENTKTKIEHVPNLPRLIVSGSATQLTYNQIKKLKEEGRDIFFIDLTVKDIIEGFEEKIYKEIIEILSQNKDVVVHCSYIDKEITDENSSNQLIDAGIAKDEFPSNITDFLADLVYEINMNSKFILIMIGGETSFKCARKIDSKYLQILDAILPAIPLCMDANGKIIVTKSGNFGTPSTLLEILNYFNRLKNENI